MDDLSLRAELDGVTTLFVTPIDNATYMECIDDDALGGADGYFVVRSCRDQSRSAFEVLAKAATFEAAGVLFDMIVSGRARQPYGV
ncbi:hypothetical protein [Sphingomonas sp. CFBP 8764]|uniref:hypothetical protein n=1 Tax=Sphingomonas sp. CFBP 8764 TaxID=2775275 RepID=UPI0017826951|nr:hypothetical protein [Sphingomonas sp. CFBP 8764]MBD8551293.1 hypothetical protein [Sphingomonas sp. CFBP 8764]